MPRCMQNQRSRRVRITVRLSVAIAVGVVSGQMAHALITGGEGKSPIADPGWPRGAAAIFNDSGRVA
jgi:hypothetical protein